MPTKRITPLGLIGSITSVAAFVAIVFAVDARYVTRAQAAEQVTVTIQQQQLDRVETDLALVDLEIKFLQDKKIRILKMNADAAQTQQPQVLDDDTQKRLNYLEQRRLILEKYQLELQAKPKF